jgi:hypothetical protein
VALQGEPQQCVRALPLRDDPTLQSNAGARRHEVSATSSESARHTACSRLRQRTVTPTCYDEMPPPGRLTSTRLHLHDLAVDVYG